MGGRHVLGIERFPIGRGLPGEPTPIVAGLSSRIVQKATPRLATGHTGRTYDQYAEPDEAKEKRAAPPKANDVLRVEMRHKYRKRRAGMSVKRVQKLMNAPPTKKMPEQSVSPSPIACL
jgi:hypothetical protein